MEIKKLVKEVIKREDLELEFRDLKKFFSSKERIKAQPVHCKRCSWVGKRKYGPLKNCPKCNGVVIWTFLK